MPVFALSWLLVELRYWSLREQRRICSFHVSIVLSSSFPSPCLGWKWLLHCRCRTDMVARKPKGSRGLVLCLRAPCSATEVRRCMSRIQSTHTGNTYEAVHSTLCGTFPYVESKLQTAGLVWSIPHLHPFESQWPHFWLADSNLPQVNPKQWWALCYSAARNAKGCIIISFDACDKRCTCGYGARLLYSYMMRCKLCVEMTVVCDPSTRLDISRPKDTAERSISRIAVLHRSCGSRSSDKKQFSIFTLFRICYSCPWPLR